MNIDLSQMSSTQIYHLMTQTVIPRPIAWILTDSGNASYNLAPFSYFSAVSSNPPLLMVSVGKKPSGDLKDTTRNVLNNEKLVINIPAFSDAQSVTASSETLEHGISEPERHKIELEPMDNFALPRVKSCPIAYACKLHKVIEMGEVPQSLIFAEIEQVYIDDSVIDTESERLKIDALKVNPLSRLGGNEYASLNETITVARPK